MNILPILLCSTVCLASADETKLTADLPRIFSRAAAHYRALDAAATPLMRDGEGGLRTPHGRLKWKSGKDEFDMRDILGWTAGHYAGSLWRLYEATGDAFFRDRATVWTEILAPNAKVTDNHDVGFIMYCSYGNARRLLKTEAYDGLLKETARSLCTRFNPDLGLIRSWGDVGDEKHFQVIPDNLMNLELLMWASRHGDVRAGAVARSHADVTMVHHFKADGGCYHVLDYDQKAKVVQGVLRGQGLGPETSWSRGQSWAIYGYSMMYRETGDRRYLDFARKLADFAIRHSNMPADGVPYWDYGAPGEERDSSAAAIMASGLLELAHHLGAPEGNPYRAFAVRQLLALASPEYFSEGDEIGHFLLKHGVGHKPCGQEIDTPLVYGDYYFLEALLRFQKERTLTTKKTTPIYLVGCELDLDGSELLHSFDTFRKEDWTVFKHGSEPKWEFRGETLAGGGLAETRHGQVFYKTPVKGDVVLEFDARTIAPSYHDIVWLWGARFDEEPWNAGFLGCLGGWWDDLAGIESLNAGYEPSAIHVHEKLVPGRWYHIVSGTVRGIHFIVVDGKLVTRYAASVPKDREGYFGLGFYESYCEFAHLKVWRPKTTPVTRRYAAPSPQTTAGKASGGLQSGK